MTAALAKLVVIGSTVITPAADVGARPGIARVRACVRACVLALCSKVGIRTASGRSAYVIYAVPTSGSSPARCAAWFR